MGHNAIGILFGKHISWRLHHSKILSLRVLYTSKRRRHVGPFVEPAPWQTQIPNVVSPTGTTSERPVRYNSWSKPFPIKMKCFALNLHLQLVICFTQRIYLTIDKAIPKTTVVSANSSPIFICRAKIHKIGERWIKSILNLESPTAVMKTHMTHTSLTRIAYAASTLTDLGSYHWS